MNLLIYTLFPIIFMIHEFEEIIFIKHWLIKNREYLYKKFPKIGPKFYMQYSEFTTAGLALAIFEEFIIFCILTYLSIIFQNTYIWLAIFMGFFIHLIPHILPGLFLKKLIPGIVTSILIIPYFAYGLIEYINKEIYTIEWLIICSILGIIGMLLNLKIMHYLGKKFSRWE